MPATVLTSIRHTHQISHANYDKTSGGIYMLYQQYLMYNSKRNSEMVNTLVNSNATMQVCDSYSSYVHYAQK